MSLKIFDFEDTTNKIEFIFNRKEEVCGHSFTHLGDGMFKADTPFVFTKKELAGFGRQLIFFCENMEGNDRWNEDKNRYRVLYAVNGLWCGLAVYNEFVFVEKIIAEWLQEHGEPVRTVENEYGQTGFSKDYTCLSSNDTEEKTDAFEPVNRDRRPLGEREYVNLNGSLGYLTEPGIYYFPEGQKYRGHYSNPENARINLNMTFDIPCAMIGFSTDIHFSCTCGIRFLAVGEAAIKRLKEIYKAEGGGFIHFFEIKSDDGNHSLTSEAFSMDGS